MFKSLTIFGLAVTLLGTGLAVGCREKRSCSPEKKIVYMAEKISDELDLNEEQQAQLDQFKDEAIEKSKNVKTQCSSTHKEIIEKIRSDEISKDYLNSVANKKEAAYKDFKKFSIDRVLKLYNTLTPEQKLTLADKLEDCFGGCKLKY